MGFGKIISGTSFYRAQAPVKAIVSDGGLAYPAGHPLFVGNTQPEGMLLLNLRFDEYSEFRCDINSDITVHLFQQSAGARYKLFLYPTTRDNFTISFNNSHEQTYSCNGKEPVHVLNVEVYELNGKLYQKLTTADIAISETFMVNGVSQGAYNSGDLVEQGTPVTEVIRKMLQKELPVTYRKPKLSLSANSKSGTIAVETGTYISPVFEAVFTQNDGGEVTSYALQRNGTEVHKTAVLSQYSEPGIQVAEPVTYKAIVNYAEGAIKTNNFGQPVPEGHIGQGATTAQLTFKPERMNFYTVDTQKKVPTGEDIRNFTSIRAGRNLTLNVPAKTERIVIATTTQLQTIKYVELGNAEVLDTFQEHVIDVAGANGYKPVPYHVYVYMPAVPFPSPATYKIN